jgi:protoporphyrinogen oxidase
MPKVIVVGGGFAGLAAAYELTRTGCEVTLIEAESTLGGLAGSFQFGGQPLEKFYHHWFVSDGDVDALVSELGLADRVTTHATQTGTYFANHIFRLSNPADLLRYRALPFLDRLRLGTVALAAGSIWSAESLEQRTAAEWLKSAFGARVYSTVWQPLLEGKFGSHANRVSAVWMWSKLALRGRSRGRSGGEMLRYFDGGFAALADAIGDAIKRNGGTMRLGAPVTALTGEGGRTTGVVVEGETMKADAVILTPALPIVAKLAAAVAPADWIEALGRIDYLGNICLVLALDRSLSETYWLNVNDPTFPFVGVIEHTNLERLERYAGRHIVYLSKYLDAGSDAFAMDDVAWRDYALPYLQRVFPEFGADWVKAFAIHRARHAQPVVVPGYRNLVPDHRTPVRGLWLATMAQVYPEDRGTNYAIRDGRNVARMVAEELASAPSVSPSSSAA